ncbi:MAG: hypothetical protein IT522_09570 [Burkholderiales bacterium]|nr:hypothetical protein [Burkholderiales bacterium]
MKSAIRRAVGGNPLLEWRTSVSIETFVAVAAAGGLRSLRVTAPDRGRAAAVRWLVTFVLDGGWIRRAAGNAPTRTLPHRAALR